MGAKIKATGESKLDDSHANPNSHSDDCPLYHRQFLELDLVHQNFSNYLKTLSGGKVIAILLVCFSWANQSILDHLQRWPVLIGLTCPTKICCSILKNQFVPFSGFSVV